MSNFASSYTSFNGGRVLLLLLLFLLALYELATAGFNAFAMICLSPLLIVIDIHSFQMANGCYFGH